jgi:hypothetical protein
VIQLELTPQQIDIVFFALQNAPLNGLTYAQVNNVLESINTQGKPQLDALTTVEEIKPGGTD